MMKKEAWEKFMDSGRIDDYLRYKAKQQNYLEEIGTEVHVKEHKGGNSEKNHRRDRS